MGSPALVFVHYIEDQVEIFFSPNLTSTDIYFPFDLAEVPLVSQA